MNIKIIKLSREDKEKTFDLIRAVIIDNFTLEGTDMEKYKDLLDEEFANQSKRLNSDPNYLFPSFYIAKENEQIVGVMGYGSIEQATKDALKQINKGEEGLVEIFSAYVSPKVQKQGIGSRLLEAILNDLRTKNYRYLCLSTGYQKGKAFWSKKFGEPTVILQNYYYDNSDCWVWIKEIKRTAITVF